MGDRRTAIGGSRTATVLMFGVWLVGGPLATVVFGPTK